MAWNPSPEVAAARDFGQTFGADRVVILHLDQATGRIGYASYGKTRALCADAKVLGDVAMEAVMTFLRTGERP
jgi:hypothetical protein